MGTNDTDNDELSSLSPSPAPETLHSKSQKATMESEDDILVEERVPLLQKGVPKSTHSRKRVEVVLTMNVRKARKRAPSVIVVRGSSGSEETNVGGKCKALDDSTKPLVSEDEQDPSIHKWKARFQQSSHPMKRVLPSLDTNTAQPSTLKAVKPLFQARSVKKKRLRIISPPICESFDEEGSEAHPPKDRGS